MGYHLYVGGAVRRGERFTHVPTMDGEKLGAPRNSNCNYDNHVMPSYGSWAAFAERTETVPIFWAGKKGYEDYKGWTYRFAEKHSGLIYEHPGVVILTEDHLNGFKAALNRHQEKYNDLVEPADLEVDAYADKGPDYSVFWDRRRLNWLVWWTEWAMKNRKYPAFGNH